MKRTFCRENLLEFVNYPGMLSDVGFDQARHEPTAERVGLVRLPSIDACPRGVHLHSPSRHRHHTPQVRVCRICGLQPPGGFALTPIPVSPSPSAPPYGSERNYDDSRYILLSILDYFLGSNEVIIT